MAGLQEIALVNERETVEILAVGADPDDVELGCGGTPPSSPAAAGASASST